MCLRSQRVPNVQSCSLIVSSPAAPSWQQTLQTRLLCIRGWMQQEFTASDVSVCLDAEEWFFWKVPLGFFFFFWHNESLLEKSIQTVALCISKAPRRSFKASLKKKTLLFSVALLSLELEFSLLVFCDPRPSLLLVWFGWHDTGARLCQSDRK